MNNINMFNALNENISLVLKSNLSSLKLDKFYSDKVKKYYLI